MTVYDFAYAMGLTLSSPIWLLMPKLRRKILDAVGERNGAVPLATGQTPGILIHAVSVGEINATTSLVRLLAQNLPEARFILSTTSRTGEARARQLYANQPQVTLIRFPFDFSQSVNRMLDAQRPAVAVLMELEVWPNFIHACAGRNIPVLLINGRLSAHSFRRYRLIAPVGGRMFRRLHTVLAQDDLYAERFRRVGVPVDRIRVTGTMKFDTAQIADRIEGDDALANAVGLQRERDAIWVCGSTGPGEEAAILDTFQRLQGSNPTLRLVIVPRHPERFDEVAGLITTRGYRLVRRSGGAVQAAAPGDSPPIILGDTMGELRKFYSLGTIVLVGRSLVDLGPKQHGSDMIEPAALAKPVIVGPFTGNFADVMSRFREAGAIREIGRPSELLSATAALLADPAAAAAMARRAQEVVRENQGATQRHVEVILRALGG